MDNENLILVYYVNVLGLKPDEVFLYMKKVAERISSESISEKNEIIFIPVNGENRVECINPKYIKDMDLIKNHERLMGELHDNLNEYLKNLKNE